MSQPRVCLDCGNTEEFEVVVSERAIFSFGRMPDGTYDLQGKAEVCAAPIVHWSTLRCANCSSTNIRRLRKEAE
jgi:hypothetical protein